MNHIITSVIVILCVLIATYCHNKIKQLIWLQHDYDKNISKYEYCPRELYVSIENSVKLIQLVVGRLISIVVTIIILLLYIIQ